MPFNYDKLWALLSNKNISKEELRNKIKCSQTTIVNMGKNLNVSLDVIDRIANVLECHPFDILEYIPDDKKINNIIPLRGEIYFANMIKDDSEGKDIRPVVIIQNNIANQYAPSVIVVPMSSKVANSNSPTHIKVNANDNNGLSHDSIILTDSMQPISKYQLLQKVGCLSEDELQKVDNACKIVLGLTC